MAGKKAPALFDITFVGAGPTGLFGAFYAGLRELSVKVIDALPKAGGQLITLYPEKWIYDTPGFHKIRSKDLVENLLQQASQWQPEFVFDQRALKLTQDSHPDAEPDERVWMIETDKERHYTKTVVIAAGIGAFEPIHLKNESVDRFENKGVTYMVHDLEAYTGQRVLVVGGGDSAVDWALALEPIAEKVTLIHRRDGFRAHESSVNALFESSVDVLVFHELRELQGGSKLERAVIFNNQNQEERTLDIDSAVLALGFKADLGPIRTWGLETIGRRYIQVNKQMETNLPGVYAAGDVALQEDLDPLNLIVIGYGQVTVAVNYAYTKVKPGEKVFPGHSSEKLSKKS
ncbi:MAG: NAD(P)/FAD-dependent oxidoreductase [Anaerolineales bacterium]